MPYQTNEELPPHIKKLPAHQQDAFRKAFNSALKEYKDESTAFAVATKAAENAKESYMQTEFCERDFSTAKRKELAKSGAALPDGSYPIENKSDLENAIKAIGRATNPDKVKAHIKTRAKALGCTDCIPDTWESWQAVADGDLICEATFTHGDSHDGLKDKLSDAIDGAVMSGKDMDGDGDGPLDAQDRMRSGSPQHYVRAVHDKHVIYSMGGKTFAHKYETDGDGDPHLKGSPTEVEPAYKTVEKNNPGDPQQGSKESFSESFALGRGQNDMFVEANGYDPAKGELTMTIIRPGLSKNNRYYSPEMLKRDHKVFEGAKMFADHATDKESAARPEGSVNNWVAQMKNTWAENDGTVRGKAVVIDPNFKQKLAALGEHGMLPSMGVSIRAVGASSDGVQDGKKCKVIEGIKVARSVDFVTFAGAGGQVESLN